MKRLFEFLKGENGQGAAEWGVVFGVAVTVAVVFLYYKMKADAIAVGKDWL
jgi:Flp pilus assembly pilin Flp